MSGVLVHSGYQGSFVRVGLVTQVTLCLSDATHLSSVFLCSELSFACYIVRTALHEVCWDHVNNNLM